MTKVSTRVQYVEDTDDILDFAVGKLEEYSGWNVCKFQGTGYSQLFRFIPEIRLPAAVVCYNSSTYNKESLPARTLDLEVVVAVDFYSQSDKSILRELLHKTIQLLDGEIFNTKVRFDIVQDNSVELGANVTASVIKFHVENY